MNPFDPTTPSAQPILPFTASLEGWTTGSPDDWPNTVTVSTISVQASDTEPDGEDVYYADSHGERELVEIDTNYKATRTGQHPVRLTRTDAIQLAVYLLQATEDTFHYGRRGPLRSREAAELLRAVEEIDFALSDLRSHALSDLLRDAAVDPDDQPQAIDGDTANTDATEPTPTSSDPSEAGALREVFSAEFAAQVHGSDAFGALVYRIQECAAATGLSPVEVLQALDADDRAFALRAQDPAAFLAAKVRELNTSG
ncbi:hypothetical protein [Kutzneria kofuensis]|uniref:Uncharacterized protein n=1 Tax=Kutzneria kofuensis TaxID=103725 RepID=A0A7W9KHM2_9PSEU|nr:hypothetical protein [Kutzneria kofuensis]MBB5892617.1 hypothetical protein [Kutzneria kofuensis]